MQAFITGASSGLGREIAKELGRRGYDLILVARRTERLEALRKTISTHVKVISADLSVETECYRVCKQMEHEQIDIAVNNAGVGVCGAFVDNTLESEMQMLHINVHAVHIFTKFFARKFVKQSSGIIWNIASSAAFLPGPYMAAYYATKAYVLRLSNAVREEVKDKNVRVCVFCPGPVKTEFDSVAGVRASLKGADCRKTAIYGVKKMLEGKRIIVPGFLTKLCRIGTKITPDVLLAKIAGKIQKGKLGEIKQ